MIQPARESERQSVAPGVSPGISHKNKNQSPVRGDRLQAIRVRSEICRPLRGLNGSRGIFTPGSRPGLNSAAIFDGSLNSYAARESKLERVERSFVSA